MLSEEDQAIVQSTLAGVAAEKLPRIRKGHADACARLRRGGDRAYEMHAYAIRLIDEILQPPEDASPFGPTSQEANDPPEDDDPAELATTSAPRAWDQGDEATPPPPEVIAVFDYTAPTASDGVDSAAWGRVVGSEGREWKGYKNGGKVYLSWPELLRRWGPVTGAGGRA